MARKRKPDKPVISRGQNEGRNIFRRGRAPEVDKHFVKYFPQYMDYLEAPLRHHHIGEGGQAAALPVTLHPGYGGVHNIEKEWGITGVDDINCKQIRYLIKEMIRYDFTTRV